MLAIGFLEQYQEEDDKEEYLEEVEDDKDIFVTHVPIVDLSTVEDSPIGGGFIPREGNDESSNHSNLHVEVSDGLHSGGFMLEEERSTYPFILEAIKESALVSDGNLDPYIPGNDDELTNDTDLMRRVHDTVTEPTTPPEERWITVDVQLSMNPTIIQPGK